MIQRIYNGIFPKPIFLGQKEQTLLQQMFPTVNWAYVRCYQGLPWFVRSGNISAMALPSFDGRYIHLHFDSYQNLDSYALSMLVHEAFHVLQYRDLGSMNWWNIGFARRFMRHYIGWYLALLVKNWLGKRQAYSQANYEAYRYHPLEITAYNHEAAFAQHLPHYRHQDDAQFFISSHPQLVQNNAQYTTRPPWWAWAIGTFLTILITLAKPLIELVLWGFTRMLGAKKNNTD